MYFIPPVLKNLDGGSIILGQKAKFPVQDGAGHAVKLTPFLKDDFVACCQRHTSAEASEVRRDESRLETVGFLQKERIGNELTRSTHPFVMEYHRATPSALTNRASGSSGMPESRMNGVMSRAKSTCSWTLKASFESTSTSSQVWLSSWTTTYNVSSSPSSKG